MRPRAIPLADLPECEPNTSRVHCVLERNGTLWLAYNTKSPNWPDEDVVSVVRISRCLVFRGGGPNDEAFHNHPLNGVVDALSSVWAALRARGDFGHERIQDGFD